MDEQLKNTIGPALGRIPSGVFILTAGNGRGSETGMLASWVQQASFDPPRISVAVNKSRYLNAWVEAHPEVAVSTVSDADKTLFRHFGKGFEPDEPAFEGLNVTQASNGLTIPADAYSHLCGTVVGKIDAGDHYVYIVDVTGGAMSDVDEGVKPFVHIRKNGFGY